MTALENIKEIEKHFKQYRQNGAYVGPIPEDCDFLLRAFNVMREIAIEYKQQVQYSKNQEQELNVDQEFEISMRMFEKRMSK